MIYVNLNYLKNHKSNVDVEKINLFLIQRNRKLFDEPNLAMVKAIMDQPDIKADVKDYNKDAIVITCKSKINTDVQEKIKTQLKTFSPWRKGPFHIFGIDIDAEWKSQLKWNRIAPFLDTLENKTVCDLGCNNGYFMFKAAAHKPALVMGFDPTRKFKLAFHYINRFAGEPNLHMELLGFDDLQYFKDIFDTLFCMGIIYHHENPMTILRYCNQSMKKGGQIVLETMGISSGDPLCLFPEKRYANMPNVWFVPSQAAVKHMLVRAGFRDIQCVYNEFLDTDEQRKTSWADVESLKDFLDPENPRLTIEGYEAPSRIYFVARK
ncbi:MAG: tRNA 5-methoxyuridine(34)/uridine 5-oxyacetic acid(34) synthase CmoB [Spirochaetia bacterium]|nr:tRNA 5-methoxyuridine(34)/uridine 5-oxyacetic acid(34) synthase CmoB [Spirochaetia bacterium]